MTLDPKYLSKHLIQRDVYSDLPQLTRGFHPDKPILSFENIVCQSAFKYT